MNTQDPKYKHKPSEKHTLEEVLKSLQDLIRNDLLDEDRPAEPAEKSAAAPGAVQEKPAPESAPPAPEDFTPRDPAAGPVNFDAVMRSLKDLVNNELNIGEEPTMPGPSSLSDTVSPETLEELADELAPLDEELTFEESMEIIPPPPAEKAMPEIPGEISAEMFAEPEPEATSPAPGMPNLPGEISAEMFAEPESPPPPPEPKPASQEPVVRGTQQELIFDVEPPTIEARTPFREQAPERKPETPAPSTEPETPPESPAPDRAGTETSSVAAEENLQAASEAALPTIEVEETFDESAFFETAEPSKPSPATDSAESDGITIEHAADLWASESPPDLGNEPLTLEELTLAPEPEKPELEIEEPALEKLRDMPSVDFETIEFQPPGGESPASSADAETPKPDEKPLSIAEEVSLAPETTPESAPVTAPPAAAETATEAASETTKIPGPESASPAATGPSEPASTAEPPAPPKAPEAFSLDDIPVLNEVVAPPAGSTLAGGMTPAEPSLPAPDRARDIVVRAVAKLNVEMRKTGGAGLDTKTILRLQQLIRQELEQDGGKS